MTDVYIPYFTVRGVINVTVCQDLYTSDMGTVSPYMHILLHVEAGKNTSRGVLVRHLVHQSGESKEAVRRGISGGKKTSHGRNPFPWELPTREKVVNESCQSSQFRK